MHPSSSLLRDKYQVAMMREVDVYARGPLCGRRKAGCGWRIEGFVSI